MSTAAQARKRASADPTSATASLVPSASTARIRDPDAPAPVPRRLMARGHYQDAPARVMGHHVAQKTGHPSTRR